MPALYFVYTGAAEPAGEFATAKPSAQPHTNGGSFDLLAAAAALRTLHNEPEIECEDNEGAIRFAAGLRLMAARETRVKQTATESL